MQHLARINLVGMRKHGLVGFKNLGVFIGCTVKLFADFVQFVTADHGVELKFRLRNGNCHHVVYSSDMCYVSAAQQYFFLGGLVWCHARYSYGKSGGIEADVERLNL